MSQLIIRESTDFDETSDDSDLSDWQRDEMHYARGMTNSKDKVDKRLINMYLIRKAHQQKTYFGFDNELIRTRTRSMQSSGQQQHRNIAADRPSLSPSAEVNGDEFASKSSSSNGQSSIDEPGVEVSVKTVARQLEDEGAPHSQVYNYGSNLSGLGLGIASPKSFGGFHENKKTNQELSSPGMTSKISDRKTER